MDYQLFNVKPLNKFWLLIAPRYLIGILLEFTCVYSERVIKLSSGRRHNLGIRRAGLTLLWRHNGRDGVSNHHPHDCLLNRLFRRRSKKTAKLRVTGLCAGNSPGTGEFPAQIASNAENVAIWWRHHDLNQYPITMLWGTGLILDLRPANERRISPGVLFKCMADFERCVVTTFAVVNCWRFCFMETEMSSFWWNFLRWLHWKLSKWQLPVQPVIKISSKWRHFRFCDITPRLIWWELMLQTGRPAWWLPMTWYQIISKKHRLWLTIRRSEIEGSRAQRFLCNYGLIVREPKTWIWLNLVLADKVFFFAIYCSLGVCDDF